MLSFFCAATESPMVATCQKVNTVLYISGETTFTLKLRKLIDNNNHNNDCCEKKEKRMPMNAIANFFRARAILDLLFQIVMIIIIIAKYSNINYFLPLSRTKNKALILESVMEFLCTCTIVQIVRIVQYAHGEEIHHTVIQ